jgi:hypothetical protein
MEPYQYEPIFDPDKEFDLQRDLREERTKRVAIRKAAEDAGDATRNLTKEDTDTLISDMIDLADERARLMVMGEEIVTDCPLCGRIKTS